MNLQERRRFRSALLFTGHMVDLPGMPRPRFPPRLEFPAAHAIEAAIDRQLERAQPGDVVAISSLARGGDILFQEGAEVRRLTSCVVLPFEPQVFVRKGGGGSIYWRLGAPILAHLEPCTERAARNRYELVG
jgi:hypothetical protein